VYDGFALKANIYLYFFKIERYYNISMIIPCHSLLSFRFKILKPIGPLPFFPGARWKAFWSYSLKGGCLPEDLRIDNLNDIQLGVLPLDVGLRRGQKGDVLTVLLNFRNSDRTRRLMKTLITHSRGFWETKGSISCGGRPQDTLELLHARCVFCGKDWRDEDPCECVLNEDFLKPQVDFLIRTDLWELHSMSPLFVKSPLSERSKGKDYCDPELLMSKETQIEAWKKIFSSFRHGLEEIEQGEFTQVVSGWNWHRVQYQKKGSILHGVLGGSRFSSALSRCDALRLAAGQFLGVGKHPTFGLGYFRVSGFELLFSEDLLNLITRQTSLLDGITGDKLEEARDKFFQNDPLEAQTYSRKVLLDHFKQLKTNRWIWSHEGHVVMEKESGGTRTLRIPPEPDRIQARCLMQVLRESLDLDSFRVGKELTRQELDELSLIYKHSYETRINRGCRLAVKQTFDWIRKSTDALICTTDIQRCFDSINRDRLLLLLKGMFSGDLFVDILVRLFGHWSVEGIKGVPQGNPLSSLLCTVYLNELDRRIGPSFLEDVFYLRYADDLLFIFKGPKHPDQQKIQHTVNGVLARWDLQLAKEKTRFYQNEWPVKHLGWLVSPDRMQKNKTDKKIVGHRSPGKNLLQRSVVYLTPSVIVAEVKGKTLLIRNAITGTHHIPLNKNHNLHSVEKKAANRASECRLVFQN